MQLREVSIEIWVLYESGNTPVESTKLFLFLILYRQNIFHCYVVV